MNTWQQPLAFTDLETTGADPTEYEIMDIGLIVVDQQSHEVLKEYSTKVKPEHPDHVEPFARNLNQFSIGAWKDAVNLKTAIQQYADLTQGAIFCSWRVAFDFDFMRRAFKQTGVPRSVDIQTQICVYTMARYFFRDQKLEPFHSTQVCEALGMPDEPKPHQALNGARKSWEIYQRLIRHRQ